MRQLLQHDNGACIKESEYEFSRLNLRKTKIVEQTDGRLCGGFSSRSSNDELRVESRDVVEHRPRHVSARYGYETELKAKTI